MSGKAASVLYFFDHFYPAYKAGGPIQSAIAISERLSPDLDIHLVTSAYDLGESSVMKGVKVNEFTTVKGINVWYLKGIANYILLIRQIRRLRFDIYHFNSIFSPAFTILPFLLVVIGAIPAAGIVISPRGELSAQALSIKTFRKKIYLKMFRKLIRKPVLFHVTSPEEFADVKRVLSVPDESIFLAQDLHSSSDLQSGFCEPVKKGQSLTIVLISRIAPIKNIDFCLESLKNVRCRVDFQLFGHIEDRAYFEELNRLAQALPANVKFLYKGAIRQEEVISVIQSYDLLYLPSKSENFGHVILEALSASRPVLISDRTFWNDVGTFDAGWALPLTDQNAFADRIEQLAILDREQYRKYCLGAFNRAWEYFHDATVTDQYISAYKTSQRRRRCVPEGQLDLR